MEAKFKVGDVIFRSACKDCKSSYLREECTVVDIVSDGRPFHPQLWYITVDTRNKVRNGLVSVVDGCFEKVC